MKKAWMAIIIIASLLALAGAGFVIFHKVDPANLDKKLGISGNNTSAQNKQASRKDRIPKSSPRKIVLRSQTPVKSSSEMLEEFSSMDEVGRIRFIAALYSYEPSLLKLALTDKSKDVRITAVRFVSIIPEDQVDISPFLTMALDDESAEVREEARNVMDSVNDDNTMLRIIGTSINSKYADTRLKSVTEFNNLGASKGDFKKLMLKSLDDEDINVRNSAIATASSLWGKEFESGQEAVEYIGMH